MDAGSLGRVFFSQMCSLAEQLSIGQRGGPILPSVYTYPHWFDWVEGTDGKPATSLLLPPRSPAFDVATVRPRGARSARRVAREGSDEHPCVAPPYGQSRIAVSCDGLIIRIYSC